MNNTLKQKFKKSRRDLKRIVVATVVVGTAITITTLVIRERRTSNYVYAASKVIDDLGGDSSELIANKMLDIFGK